MLARIDALQAAIVSGLTQLGVHTPGQSIDAAIQKAAQAAAEAELAEFSDSDPRLASEIRARIATFLDDQSGEPPGS